MLERVLSVLCNLIFRKAHLVSVEVQGVCARERYDAFLRELQQMVLLSPFLQISRMYCYVQFRVPGSSQCKTRPARAHSASLGSLWTNHIYYVVYRKWFSKCIGGFETELTDGGVLDALQTLDGCFWDLELNCILVL